MKQQKQYFAAANGYSGFRSNFPTVFSPKALGKLFIIKGGPGTGKSTLMRRIAKRYSEELDTTTILCSSDTNSVDGILLSKNEITVGIVDGTSPHVLEPSYPGAIEEIINLGDSFDYKALRQRKDEIIALTDMKKNEYSKAYRMLKATGDVFKYITDNSAKLSGYISAELQLDTIYRNKNTRYNQVEVSPYLVGSFSKNGYKRIYEFDGKNQKIGISGDGISEYILLLQIAEKLRDSGIGFKMFPSAYSENIPDMIVTCDKIYYISDNPENTFDATEVVKNNNEYPRLKQAYGNLLEASRLSLCTASEYHFMLESIYSKSVRFEENENKYDYVIKTIDAIFTNNVD